jgi:hypothetical protein
MNDYPPDPNREPLDTWYVLLSIYRDVVRGPCELWRSLIAFLAGLFDGLSRDNSLASSDSIQLAEASPVAIPPPSSTPVLPRRWYENLYFWGPRGGLYRIDSKGKKIYDRSRSLSTFLRGIFDRSRRVGLEMVSEEAVLPADDPPVVTSVTPSLPAPGRFWRQDRYFLGPRGGRYRIDSKGKKRYDRG